MKVLLIILGLALSFDVFAKQDPAKNDYIYIISLKQGNKNLGDIKIRLFPDVAPMHCRNFDSLVSIGFYNGLAFHRVVPGFMMQGGCPNSKNKPKDTWGMGDPSQRKIPAEFSKLKHKRGTISAARTNDPNSATSQFFICFKDSPWLDGKYSIFGEVVEGFDVMDKVEKTALEKQPYSNEVSSPVEKIEMTIRKLK
ncbi:MAG: peptidylprolyl isomerase [Candidatus Kapaibacteriota bacterium]|jgi:peptidyl-prolyl cis-trans isomerase B (cyclophilin B)